MPYIGEGRKKLRLENFDYGNQGYYFLTLCTKGRINYFGEIQDGAIELNDYGKIVKKCWEKITRHYENILLDEYVVMPNHIHGIIIVGNEYFRSDISNIIKGFKIGVTKEIRHFHNDFEFGWQKSFYDTIIRTEEQLEKTREYIVMNPEKWDSDKNNLQSIQS